MQNESNLPAKYKAIERFAYNFLTTTPIGIISRWILLRIKLESSYGTRFFIIAPIPRYTFEMHVLT